MVENSWAESLDTSMNRTFPDMLRQLETSKPGQIRFLPIVVPVADALARQRNMTAAAAAQHNILTQFILTLTSCRLVYDVEVLRQYIIECNSMLKIRVCK